MRSLAHLWIWISSSRTTDYRGQKQAAFMRSCASGQWWAVPAAETLPMLVALAGRLGALIERG
jgi:hypothetical protein